MRRSICPAAEKEKPLLGRPIPHVQMLFPAAVLMIQSRRFYIHRRHTAGYRHVIMEKKVLVKKSLTFLAESPTPNCENCNIPSPQHVRIALRCADIFYIQASDIGTGVTHRPLFRFRKTQI